MSPGSQTTDRKHKPGDYAEAGIRHFWRIETDYKTRALTIHTFSLDPATRTYATTGAHADRLDTKALGFPPGLDVQALGA